MTETTKNDYWPAYSALESQLRNVARKATIARGYAHDMDWPNGLTDEQDEEICRLFLLVEQVEDMAQALVKTTTSSMRNNPPRFLFDCLSALNPQPKRALPLPRSSPCSRGAFSSPRHIFQASGRAQSRRASQSN